MESDSLPPTLRLASSPQPPKPQTPSPPPKTSDLAEEILATMVRTNAPSQDWEDQLSQVLTPTSSQLRQNNSEEGLPTMASNDPTPSLRSFQGNDATHIAVDTMTRGIYSSLLDFCGSRDSHEYVADRMTRLIHTLRAGHSEAATPPPKSSLSLKRATPADFEHPVALRCAQAEPSQSYSDQCGVRGTGPIPSREQAYQPYSGQYEVRNTGPMPLQEQQYGSSLDQYGVRGTEPVPFQERRFQSYPGQYGVPDTMPTDWPGSQARPPAFGQFDERDTGYTRLHSPAEFKSKNSFMQAQMGVDFSTIVEPRQNFPDQRPASVSKSGHGVRDRVGISSRKRGVQASPYNTSRYDSRTSNTDNRGSDNTTSISYDQRQPDRDQQQSYGDHQMLPPARAQTRSLHTKTNRTRSELASGFGAPTTPSRRRSQASTREARDRCYTAQSRRKIPRSIKESPPQSPRSTRAIIQRARD
jgi:hypothetical protein